MAAPHVFLSHSTKDIAFVLCLEADLQRAGATVYRVAADQGGDFLRRINEALAACEYVVLVLTADALASPWVEQEIHAAIALKNRRRIQDILPIEAAPVDYNAIPPLWGVYNIFDASRDYAAGRDGLLRALACEPHPLTSSPAGRGGTPAASVPTVGAQPAAPARTPDSSVVPPRLASLGFAGYRNGIVSYIVPPVVAVPAGEFLMGSDPKRDSGAYDEEKPQHRVSLSSFQIAAFPVTVAEYACFVRGGHKEPTTSYLSFKTQLEQRLDHPVVNVSWHDAVAYVAWLAQQTGQPWRLPSEAEWEKAARGTDGRIYPWDDRFEASRANTSEGGKRVTTPVGSYPSGASPYGAQNLSGNVWEWTSSVVKPYPYTPTDGREDPNSTESRVLRGGSWLSNSRDARAAYRDRYQPDLLNLNFGLRVVLAVPSS